MSPKKVLMPNHSTMMHIASRIDIVLDAQVMTGDLDHEAKRSLKRVIDIAMDQWYEEPDGDDRICPECNGSGGTYPLRLDGKIGSLWIVCGRCEGTGSVSS